MPMRSSFEPTATPAPAHDWSRHHPGWLASEGREHTTDSATTIATATGVCDELLAILQAARTDD